MPAVENIGQLNPVNFFQLPPKLSKMIWTALSSTSSRLRKWPKSFEFLRNWPLSSTFSKAPPITWTSLAATESKLRLTTQSTKSSLWSTALLATRSATWNRCESLSVKTRDKITLSLVKSLDTSSSCTVHALFLLCNFKIEIVTKECLIFNQKLHYFNWTFFEIDPFQKGTLSYRTERTFITHLGPCDKSPKFIFIEICKLGKS